MALVRELSSVGLKLLEVAEGFRDKLYNDSAGHATIGFGHLVHRGAVGTDRASELPFVNGVTENEARHILQIDVQHAEVTVARYVSSPLSPGMFDALVLLAYNLGDRAFKNEDGKPTLLNELVNTQDVIGAALQFTRFIYSGGRRSKGLLKRRLREALLYLS